MVSQPTPAPADAADPPRDEDAQRDRADLQELIDNGMRFQSMICAAAQVVTLADAAPGAKPGASAKPLSHLATALERTARAVRRTILLKQHLAQTHLAAAQKRSATRKRIRAALENRIDAAGLQPEQADRLRRELVERVESPELDDELGHRPIEEIIREIRKDLGLDGHPGLPGLPSRTPATAASPDRPANPAATPARPQPPSPPLAPPHQFPLHQPPTHPVPPRHLE